MSGDAGPITNYVLSKICGDMFATYFSESHKVPVAILRYYYPYSEIAGVVPSTVQQVLGGQPIADNPAAVNPLFISDVVNFTIKAATACDYPPNLLNIGGEEIVSYNDLAVMVGRAFGREPQFTPMGQVPAESWVCDSRKRISLFGQQQVSLAQGIARVVAAFRQRRQSQPADRDLADPADAG
ncbi:MAG: NAD(P)-dependent oxidoreductase [Armatimonadetes bacterium]|nr:NAD(P)-dependent oxidoreductase [Armatimonadota bacterium]